MKKILLLSALAIFTAITTKAQTTNKQVQTVKKSTNIVNIADSDYEEGWEDGYCEGWKDIKGQYAICPITPICPIPKIDCSEGYRCGYNRGFKAGMRAALND